MCVCVCVCSVSFIVYLSTAAVIKYAGGCWFSKRYSFFERGNDTRTNLHFPSTCTCFLFGFPVKT